MSALLDNAPLPVESEVVNGRDPSVPKGQQDPNERHLSFSWTKYLTVAMETLNRAVARLADVTLLNQTASIAATDFSPGVAEGLWEVRWYARVTQAAGTSSSLQISIGWTDGGVAQSRTKAAITGNTTATNDQDGPFMIHCDASSPITYTITYASVGAPVMKYAAYFTLHKVKA